MADTSWALSNFIGLHTQRAKAKSGEAYASDMQNLRIDGDGWLRLRSDVAEIGPTGAKITGIAATQKHLFLLRADGKLYIRDKDTLDKETEVPGISGLKDGISVVGQFRDYAIITSEGDDQGFWIDSREGKELRAYPNGFDPPTPDITYVLHKETHTILFTFTPAITEHGFRITVYVEEGPAIREIPINAQPNVDPRNYLDPTIPERFDELRTFLWDGRNREGEPVADAPYFITLHEVEIDDDGEEKTTVIETQKVTVPPIFHDKDNIYLYRFTYLREAPGELFGNMESNPSDPIVVDMGDNTRVQFKNLRFNNDDGLETHIAVYRASIRRKDYEAGKIDIHAQDHGYRLLGTAKRSSTNPREIERGFFDDYPHFTKTYHNEELEFNNDRMPPNVKQLHEYNDLVFGAAGDRLIYSDLRFGNLTPWTFPAKNEIRVQGNVDFCAEIREVLVFGSNDGLWRLTGVTEHDFRVGSIGNIGPVDSHAWGKTQDALAFVGEGGLYMSDASSVTKVSDLYLDEFFFNKRVRRGAVVFFKDGDILFSVGFSDFNANTIKDQQFKLEDGYWVRWNVQFEQATSLISNGETVVLLTDGTNEIKYIDWKKTEPEDHKTHWSWTSHYLDGQGALAETYHKRFKEFQFTGETGSEVTLETWIDDDSSEPIVATFSPRPDSLQPVRVPINRRGRRIKFRVSGTGNNKIQGLGMKMTT